MSYRLPLAAIVAFALSITVPSAFVQAGIIGGPVESATLSIAGSSGGCFPPSVAVDMYSEATNQFLVNSGDAEDCDKICDKFVDTCDDIARISRDCQNRGGGKFQQLARATCRTFEDRDDADNCKDEVKFLRDEVKDCTDDDRDRAGGCCDNHRAVCILDCLDEDIGPGDFKACFTGPGGYAGGSCWFTFFGGNSTLVSGTQ